MRTLMVLHLQMVPFNVHIQSNLSRISRSIRSFGTLFANKWLLNTMHVVHVTAIMDKSMKNFPANFTFDAQLILMRFEMRSHFIFPEERLSTFWTLIIPSSFVVPLPMLFETVPLNIPFTIWSLRTSIANIRSLDIMDVVHMPFMRSPRCKRFTANFTKNGILSLHRRRGSLSFFGRNDRDIIFIVIVSVRASTAKRIVRRFRVHFDRFLFDSDVLQ